MCLTRLITNQIILVLIIEYMHVKIVKLKKLPCQKEWLVEVIEDIKDDIIIGGRVNVGTWKLIVNENDLLGNSQRRAGPISDIPCEEQVRVFTLDSEHGPCREAEKHHQNNPCHFYRVM